MRLLIACIPALVLTASLVAGVLMGPDPRGRRRRGDFDRHVDQALTIVAPSSRPLWCAAARQVIAEAEEICRQAAEGGEPRG